MVAAASDHGEEEGKPFLAVLLAVSGVLYAGSLAAIGAMFYYFEGCPANELVMSLTLILSVVSLGWVGLDEVGWDGWVGSGGGLILWVMGWWVLGGGWCMWWG